MYFKNITSLINFFSSLHGYFMAIRSLTGCCSVAPDTYPPGYLDERFYGRGVGMVPLVEHGSLIEVTVVLDEG